MTTRILPDQIRTTQTDVLLGRDTAGAGEVEEITIGSGLSLAAGELTATGAATVAYATLAKFGGPR